MSDWFRVLAARVVDGLSYRMLATARDHKRALTAIPGRKRADVRQSRGHFSAGCKSIRSRCDATLLKA